MLRTFLDENLPPKLAKAFIRHQPEAEITSIFEWHDGILAGQSDEVILKTLAQNDLTLVTYDLATIPSLLSEFFERGESFAGVILVDDRTITQGDFKSMLNALLELYASEKDADWTNRIMFLQKPAS